METRKKKPIWKFPKSFEEAERQLKYLKHPSFPDLKTVLKDSNFRGTLIEFVEGLRPNDIVILVDGLNVANDETLQDVFDTYEGNSPLYNDIIDNCQIIPNLVNQAKIMREKKAKAKGEVVEIKDEVRRDDKITYVECIFERIAASMDQTNGRYHFILSFSQETKSSLIKKFAPNLISVMLTGDREEKLEVDDLFIVLMYMALWEAGYHVGIMTKDRYRFLLPDKKVPDKKVPDKKVPDKKVPEEDKVPDMKDLYNALEEDNSILVPSAKFPDKWTVVRAPRSRFITF